MLQKPARCKYPKGVFQRKQSPADSPAGSVTRGPSLDLSSAFQAYRHTFCGVAIGRGIAPADAEDLVQDFFLEAARKAWFKKFDPTRGSARPFITKIFRRFLNKEMAQRQTLKRGWGKLVGLSGEDQPELRPLGEGTELRSPETIFHAREASLMLGRAVDLLRQELNGKANPSTFEALIPFIDSKGKHVSYRSLGTRLGLSAGAARMKVMRLRQKLRSYVFKELEVQNDGSCHRAELVEFLFSRVDP